MPLRWGRWGGADDEKRVLELKKTEKPEGRSLPAFGAANGYAGDNSSLQGMDDQNSVNGAAVLAVGFDAACDRASNDASSHRADASGVVGRSGRQPTRAFARRVVTPLRLPVSPRQHLNRRRTEGTHKGMETRRVKLVAEPQH